MSDHDSAIRHANQGAARPRTWLWTTVLAIVLLAAAAGTYLYLSDPAEQAEPTPTKTITVTAPPPSPTISPSPRESGTAFYNQIPSEVGAYVLVATAPSPEFAEAKAYDSYLLTYSDGSHEVTLQAGQWRTEAAATDAFNAMAGPDGWPGADVDLTSTKCPEPPPGDNAALWRNVTAIFQVTAPGGGAVEFFCQMPM
ncbi:MAG: hypothetical protein LBD90_05415 [Bifidobacteriaceae bacterium]|nr:hypothetical protein [Bifidobacteriaceae bacterium]